MHLKLSEPGISLESQKQQRSSREETMKQPGHPSIFAAGHDHQENAAEHIGGKDDRQLAKVSILPPAQHLQGPDQQDQGQQRGQRYQDVGEQQCDEARLCAGDGQVRILLTFLHVGEIAEEQDEPDPQAPDKQRQVDLFVHGRIKERFDRKRGEEQSARQDQGVDSGNHGCLEGHVSALVKVDRQVSDGQQQQKKEKGDQGQGDDPANGADGDLTGWQEKREESGGGDSQGRQVGASQPDQTILATGGQHGQRHRQYAGQEQCQLQTVV